MKLLKFGLLAVAVTLAVSVGTAQASTIFFSTTSASPALINPSVTVSVGATVTLYAFWEPTQETDPVNGPGYYINEQLSGWGHTIVDDNAILTSNSYAFLTAGSRWDSTGTGTAPTGTFLVGGSGQGANAVKVGGSNLGATSGSASGYYNEGAHGVWRLSTLTVTAASAGTSHIFMDVGLAGISFQNSPFIRPINFGFSDAAVESNAFNTGSTVADATITVVPEPSTLALLGMGVVGLAVAARRRRRSA